MQPQKILFNATYFAGVSWFMNCLIELNVKVDEDPTKLFTYKSPIDQLYSEYTLQPTAAHWMPALPSLTFKNEFIFRNDLDAIFLNHEFMRWGYEKKHKTLVFIRDPRDALFTQYIFNEPAMDFHTWVIESLKNLHWFNLIKFYLKRRTDVFFRFEDYKKNPKEQLKNILTYTDITVTDQQIEAAIANSSYEKSKEGESVYKEKYPVEQRNHGDKVRNRSGKIGEWKNHPDLFVTIKLVENYLGPIMKVFGYHPEL